MWFPASDPETKDEPEMLIDSDNLDIFFKIRKEKKCVT